jgi:hypothetical protein
MILRAAFKHGVVFSSARMFLKPLRGERFKAARGVLTSQPAGCFGGPPPWLPTSPASAVSTTWISSAGRRRPFEESCCEKKTVKGSNFQNLVHPSFKVNPVRFIFTAACSMDQREPQRNKRRRSRHHAE